MDPKYEKVARVDSSSGDGEQVLVENQSDLRTLNIFRKRQRSIDHPCLTNRGGCSQICIPHGKNKRKCGCSIGYQMGDTDTECTPYDSYAVVSQLKLARGFDVNQNAEAMVPISGKFYEYITHFPIFVLISDFSIHFPIFVLIFTTLLVNSSEISKMRFVKLLKSFWTS